MLARTLRSGLAFSVLLLLAGPHPVAAGGACSNDFVLGELREGRFGRIDRVADLPPEVLEAFQATIAPHDPPLLAEPGEPFQATDDVDPKSPKLARRMVFAGFSKSLFYVYYERGGVAHTHHLFVYCHHDGRKRLLSVIDAPAVTSPRDLAVGLRRDQVVSPPRES
jgi:hypothetical protein